MLSLSIADKRTRQFLCDFGHLQHGQRLHRAAAFAAEIMVIKIESSEVRNYFLRIFAE